METTLTNIINKAIGYKPVHANRKGVARPTFSTTLVEHIVHGEFNGVYVYELSIAMSQHFWNTYFDMAKFEWKLRKEGIGTSFLNEIDGDNDIKIVTFTIREHYIKPCGVKK